MKVLTDAGELIELGTTETAPTISLTDYSRRETDDFGVTTVVARGFARRMSVRLGVPFEQVDALQRRLGELRASEAVWTADARFRWLDFRGFYKSFDVDVASPPLSICTLEVEGLAATETLFDAGGDPAAEGAASTLRLIQPIPVTDAMLAADNVPEADHPEWSGTDSYAVGARVIKGATHRIYESVAAANVGNDPSGTSGKWLDVGPTNRWAMFDQALGTATTAAGEIGIILNTAVTAVALLDVVGATVQVQAGGYDRTIAVDAGPVIFLDVPATGQVVIRVTGSGTVSVGTLLVGRLVSLGVTEASPTAGITDYSRKEVDAFGDVSIVERAFAKRMTARALIRTDAIDAVANRIASVRGRPALWIGQAGMDSLTVYGFFKDFSIEVGEAVSKLSLSIEGLSKAAPRVRPATVLIPRGFYDPATVYRDGDFVQYEGSSWLYTAPGESSGNVPPTLPDEENAYWRVLARAGRIGRDGVSAYAILLTNENHILPADPDGSVITYAGASTDVVIYSAGDDVTGSFLLSVGANPQGLAVTISGATATITGGLDAAEANATVTLRMTGRDGYAGVVLEKVFSLTKSRAGADGTSPAFVKLTASAQAVKYGESGTIVPGQSVTFKATVQNATGTPVFHQYNAAGDEVFGGPAAAFVSAGPNAWASPDPYTLIAKTDGLAIFFGGMNTLFGVGVTLDSKPGLLDRVTVVKVQDGARGTDGLDALVGYLTNESHVVPCTAAGDPITFVGANGQFRVFFGLTEVTNDCIFSEVSNSGAGVTGSGGFNGQSGGYYQADELTADVGTVLLRATYRGTSIDKAFTLTKSRAAIDGTSPALISLSATRQSIQYDKADTIVSGPITFTTQRQSTTEVPLFRIAGFNGTVFVDSTAAYLAANISHIFTSTGPDNLTITEAWMNAVVVDYGGGMRVTARLSGAGISDTLSLPKIKDGADGIAGQNAYSMVLSNEAVVLPATAGGEVTSYAAAATSIQIFRGSLDVTSAFAHTADTNPQNLSWTGGYPTYQFNGGFDAGEDTATFTFQVSGSGAHAGVVLRKTMTFAKSKAAIDGTSPPLLTLDASTYTLRQATDGSFYAGQSVTFTASRANTAGVPRFQVRDHTGAALSDLLAAEYAAAYPSTWSSANADTLVWSAAGAASDVTTYGGPNGRVSVRAYVAGTSASDTVSVQSIRDGQKGADGQGALSAFLSNESFTYAVDAANQPDAVPGGAGNGRMRVFKGPVEVTGSCTFTAQVPGNLAATIDGSGNYTTSHLYGTGGFAYLIASYEGTALVLTLTGSKSRQGGAGANAKSLYVTSTSQTITVDAAGNLSPPGQNIVFRAIKQNTGAGVTWRALDQAGNVVGTTTGDQWLIFGQDALNIINHGGSAARSMVVDATLTDGVTLSDTVSVAKLAAGANGTAGTAGANAFTLVDLSWCGDPGPDFVVKRGGGEQWNGKARTLQSYPTATVSGRMATSCFIGLDNVPEENASYTSIDAAWHRSADGHDYIVWYDAQQNFTQVGPTGGDGHLYTVIYDRQTATFVKNGIFVGTRKIGANMVVCGTFAIGTVGNTIANIAFSASGAPGTDALTLTAAPVALFFDATYDGAVKPGSSEQSVVMKLMRGDQDVTAQATWAVVGAANAGCLFGKDGRAAHVATIYDVAGTGYMDLQGTYQGVSRVFRVTFSKRLDPAPPSTATSATRAVSSYTQGNASYVEGSGSVPLVFQTSPTGAMRVSFSLSYYPVGPGARTLTMNAKTRYRPAGNGPWYDFHNEIGGSQGIKFASDLDDPPTAGEVGYEFTVQLGGSTTYEYQVITRKAGGSSTDASADGYLVVEQI